MTLPSTQTIKFKSIVLLLISIWLGLAIFTGLSQISSLFTSHHFNNHFWPHLEFLTLRVWFPWLVLTPVVLLLAIKFPVKPENWLKALILHACFLLVVSLVAGLAISLHYHFFEDMSPGMETYQPWQHIGHFLFGDSVFLFNTIIYTILVANLNIRNFAQKADQEALIASQLHSQLMESQLRALKMQINPHFLFNTLNVISVLVMKSEQAKATEMINRLSKFFRQTLDEQSHQWIPLKKELEHIEQYLAIEQVRFGERLEVIIQNEPESDKILIPSMLLQPLVENAMQHGLADKQGKGCLTIKSWLQADKLHLSIIDNGLSCDFDSVNFKQGIGLTNVKDRLAQMYQNKFSFSIKSNQTDSSNMPQGTIVTIAVPTHADNGKDQ